ncbi:bone morphogenetic protein 1-like isoform X2 [Liolophura sinensis]|uniref:bone morphogenetic protein 1-like isoform X2 n=1 Tax=Liolophura sinensis TaxID=3198878 RepID=UPI0031589FA3
MRQRDKRVPAWCLILMCLLSGLLSDKGCVYHFKSGDGVEKNGTFQSPNWPNRYSNNLRCMYKFEAKANERVKLNFTSFHLQGLPPTCSNDYLDLYTQVTPDADLLEVPSPLRFCGDMLDTFPSAIISHTSYLIFTFYTDDIRVNQGFQGTYEFIDAATVSSPYNIGTSTVECGYRIRSEQRQSGYIVSPTYPGMYSDNLFCFYKLQGKPGQRIRLRFIDFDLFNGGDYCPYDYVKIYDGLTNQSGVIGIFCGRYRDLTLFSTAEALHIEFVTKSGRVYFDKDILENRGDYSFPRRGFNITYEFSEDFVNLDFISGDSTHILGTECDQRILSQMESNGSFISPGYPKQFPINVTCRYYLDGLMDRDNLEKVRVDFEDFNIPGSMPYCTLGYVAANLQGQVEGSSGEKFCGGLLPPPLISTEPRMVMLFNTSNGVLGRGFKANYRFITDFGIPGAQVKEGMCQFLYESKRQKSGVFNSPRYPTNYGTNIDCKYIFQPEGRERVRISFESFKLPDGDPSCDNNDYIEIFEYRGLTGNATKIARYCRGIVPGPTLSSDNIRKLEIVFHSDEEHVKMGFKAIYEFVSSSDLFLNCGEHIVSDGTGGVIKSPNYPGKYEPSTYCEWTIKASRKGNSILLQFPQIKVEGLTKDGCVNAVLRIYSDDMPEQEQCGTIDAHPALLSRKDFIRLSLTSSKTAAGAAGFKITWTEVYESHSSAQCSGFLCATTSYCIAPGLKCNGVENCGTGDSSDETADCKNCAKVNSVQTLLLLMSVCLSVHQLRQT